MKLIRLMNLLMNVFTNDKHGGQFGLKCAGDRDVFGRAFSKVLGTMTHSFFFSLSSRSCFERRCPV